MYIYIWRGVWVHSRSALWNVLHRNLRISMHIPRDYLSKIKNPFQKYPPTYHPGNSTGRSTHAKGSLLPPEKENLSNSRPYSRLSCIYSNNTLSI